MPQADLLITNARVYTADAAQPRAEAVAVKENRIVFVGGSEKAAAWRGANTQVIDGRGRTLMPGFIDAHFHLLWGSVKLDNLQLDGARSIDEILTAVRTYADAHPEKGWIQGVQLLYNAIPAGQALTRQMLDSAVADRPVFLTAFDGHTSWANTEALRRGGILAGRATAAGSEIVMAGETASGELREPGASNFVRDQIPQPTAAEKAALLRKGLARAASVGITSVHNMDGSEESMGIYKAFEARGELSLRVYVPYDIKPETPLDAFAEAATWPERFNGSHVRAGAVKFFMDGVLESYTALMLSDYAERPGDLGKALFTAEQFKRMAAEADRHGLQIFVHACGDGAVRRTLDGYEHVRRVNGVRDSRHRVEHIEVIHPDDAPRFAEMGVIASMQPLHAPLSPKDGDIWVSRPGRDKWPLSFAWELLRGAGARLVYGSDWPVVSMNPLLGLYAGRNRTAWAEGVPDQRQSLENLIAGYTRDAAYAEFMEKEKGVLRTGMLADMVLLSQDLFAVPDKALAEVKPVLTVCDGRPVYQAE
ncbi:MAG: amidohydrolase [Caldilineaceae bacterium]|nr:amidohydrolase [Caldilineaceae bacterium]